MGYEMFWTSTMYFTNVSARPCLEEGTSICTPRLHRYPACRIFRSIDKFLQTRAISLFKKQGSAKENCILLCCKAVNQKGNLDRECLLRCAVVTIVKVFLGCYAIVNKCNKCNNRTNYVMQCTI